MTPAPQAHINEIEKALNHLLGTIPALRQEQTPGASLELMVITGIASEFDRANYTVTVVDQDGNPLGGKPVVASGGPHHLGGGHSSAFKVISHATNDEWLLVQGVQFKGRSAVAHEVDVALIPLDVLKPGRPYQPSGRPLLAIECKDVARSGSLADVRSFLAVLYDLTVLPGHKLPRTPDIDGSPQVQNLIQNCCTFLDRNRFSYDAFIRTGSAPTSSRDLMAHYRITPYFNFQASQSAGLNRAVMSWAGRRGI